MLTLKRESDRPKSEEIQGRGTMNEDQQQVIGRTELVVFKRSGIHGLGGFALVPIAGGTRVIEYVGEVIDKQESLRRCEEQNVFIFNLDSERDLDGSVAWNLARYINHSCSANCDAEIERGRIWFMATRDIGEGEEVTINYGYDLTEYKDYPCQCGAPECVGYIVAEEFHSHVRQRRHLNER
jgi:uncharacterized protein